MQLDTPLSALPGVGPAFYKRLLSVGLDSVEDLLFYFPFRHETFAHSISSDGFVLNQKVSLDGKLISIKSIYTRGGKNIIQGEFEHDNGIIKVSWFNQPYLAKSLKPGMVMRLTGKIGEFGNRFVLMSPMREKVQGDLDKRQKLKEESENLDNKNENDQSIVPVYSESGGLTARWIKERVDYVLKNLSVFPSDFIPSELIEKHELVSYETAIKYLHQPKSYDDVSVAKKRFAYEELFISQLRSVFLRQKWREHTIESVVNPEKYLIKLEEQKKALPFVLTEAQVNSLNDILRDMNQNIPMNRLLEGDVGSGKTVVAALAAYAMYLSGFKTMLMAPTQILAQQHLQTFQKILGNTKLKIAFVGAGIKALEEADIYIGTHALLHMNSVSGVGLTIIDEQHRFGVNQRSHLRQMHGVTHILSMTATPIPRTLALTMYGELDLSVIDQMPVGRKPVKTWVVTASKRKSGYEWIRKEIAETGGQVFVVCPFIEPSESSESIKSASHEYEKLQKSIFPDLKVGLLHGGMKGAEKDVALEKFRAKEFDILVCTPIVEVGIDIPNASIILIESAERFGLAQLHQLRGRVGRGGQQAYCLLFTSDESQEESKRLKALEESNSGIELAEVDLKLRGAGNMFGTQQHGQEAYKFADLFDLELLSSARKDAEKIIDSDPKLEKYPKLKTRVNKVMSQVEAN
jgi:ATP-dependent DNA helicase RecG